MWEQARIRLRCWVPAWSTELAPSLPVLTSDFEDPQGPAYDGVIHAGDHSPGRNATQTIRRCSMYFIRDPPCKVYRVVPEFTT